MDEESQRGWSLPNDPWVGEVSTASEYSVDKFYTASRNKKGFGSTIRITVAPEVLAELSALVASRQIAEYQTNADFFRDCLVHRLKYLQGVIQDGPGFAVSELAKTLIAVEQQERFSMLREAQNRFVRQAQENLNMARSQNEREVIVASIRAAAAETTSQEFRAQLLNLL